MALAKFQQNYAIAPLVAMQAPLAAVSGTTIALNTITAGNIASSAGAVLGGGNVNLALVEFDSLCATVQIGLTTSTITATTVWQHSDDGTNWVTVLPQNGAAYVAFAAAGTGSLVYTQRAQFFQGNPCKKYLRLAVQVGVATGAAGDNVIVSYSWRQRQTISA